jgi:hypothetical protein
VYFVKKSGRGTGTDAGRRLADMPPENFGKVKLIAKAHFFGCFFNTQAVTGQTGIGAENLGAVDFAGRRRVQLLFEECIHMLG